MSDPASAITAALASLVLVVVCSFVRPTRGECPPGWYVLDGVRTRDSWRGVTGSWSCRIPEPDDPRDQAGGMNTGARPNVEINARIYCTGGALPIVVNERTVGCQR